MVTAELNVRLKKAVKVGERVYFEGRMDREERKLIYASASAKNGLGELLASATATCVKVKQQ